ncbi:MAG: hypothetical protein RLZZ191_1458, partial [Pseudomonadota bacterium]
MEDIPGITRTSDRLEGNAARNIVCYGPVDKFVTWFYSGFLNFNNQPEGMMSYN